MNTALLGTILTADERRRLYYGTSTGESLNAAADLPSDKMVECKGENYCSIHEMGKKSQKYLSYKPSRASFWQRSNCKYAEEFHPLPLGDCEINRQLRATFAPNAKAELNVGKMSDQTSYRQSYKAYQEKMKFAKGRNFAPEQTRHTRDDSKLTFIAPHSHMMFVEHKGRWYPDSQAPKHDTHLRDPRLFTDYSTRYSEVFNREMRRNTPDKPYNSAEDNSFRIVGGSVPNKVRDFYNMRRAYSAENLPGEKRLLYHQGPDVCDLITMTLDEIKERAENITITSTEPSRVASKVGSSTQGGDKRSVKLASEAGDVKK